MSPLKAIGAAVALTPAEAGRAGDICFTSVADGPSLKEVCLGEQGILRSADPPRVLVDMGTVGPWESEEIAAVAETAGVGFLRSPVSGSTVLAEAGKLTIIASGDRAVFEAADPYLAVLGEIRHHVGPGENARYLKLIFNLNIFAQMQILRRARYSARRAGSIGADAGDHHHERPAASPFVKYKVPPLQKRGRQPHLHLGHGAQGRPTRPRGSATGGGRDAFQHASARTRAASGGAGTEQQRRFCSHTLVRAEGGALKYSRWSFTGRSVGNWTNAADKHSYRPLPNGGVSLPLVGRSMSNFRNVTGKVAVVTGAARGIGQGSRKHWPQRASMSSWRIGCLW